MNDTMERIEENRAMCEASCHDLWVGKEECEERMKLLKPPSGLWAEVVKVLLVVIPLLVTFVYGYGRLSQSVENIQSNQHRIELDVKDLVKSHMKMGE